MSRRSLKNILKLSRHLAHVTLLNYKFRFLNNCGVWRMAQPEHWNCSTPLYANASPIWI